MNLFISLDESEKSVTYRSLKAQHKKLEHDFITMTKITGLLSTLTKNYQVRGCTLWEGGGRGSIAKVTSHGEMVENVPCQIVM